MENNNNKKKHHDENAVEKEIINAEIRARLTELIERAQRNRNDKRTWLDILFNL